MTPDQSVIKLKKSIRSSLITEWMGGVSASESSLLRRTAKELIKSHGWTLDDLEKEIKLQWSLLKSDPTRSQ